MHVCINLFIHFIDFLYNYFIEIIVTHKLLKKFINNYK